MGSSSRLTDLQIALLKAFFQREKAFFLTGGAALAGFHLKHRFTQDLDLFTLDSASFERGRHALADAVACLGGEMTARQQAPGFHRYVVTRGDEAVVVDLVWERVPQLMVEKWDREGIRLDPPEEILANKLCTIASRSEVRDLVDVRWLESKGYRVEDALSAALAKDGGCTPATLAWVLDQMEIPEQADLPDGGSARQLKGYLKELVARLLRAAAP